MTSLHTLARASSSRSDAANARCQEPAEPTSELDVGASVKTRIGNSMGIGREGAGIVVDAGENASHLLGNVVAAGSGQRWNGMGNRWMACSSRRI